MAPVDSAAPSPPSAGSAMRPMPANCLLMVALIFAARRSIASVCLSKTPEPFSKSFVSLRMSTPSEATNISISSAIACLS